MGFRLRKKESVGAGLARVVRRELQSATDQLTSNSSNEAVHDARKSIKKVRSVLQLVGDDLNPRGARKRIRQASHLLSPIRDADAMIATAHSLGSRRNTELSALVESLKSRQATLAVAADRQRIRSRAARALDRVRRKAGDWRWNRTGFDVLAKAIKRSYARARSGLQDVREDNRPETWHEWRKRVKTLWYALRLLERRAPRLRRPIAEFKRLETVLGDDHNLLMLHEQVAADSEEAGWPSRARVRILIERRQRELRRQALSLGARLLAHRPKVFAQRLREFWKTSRAARRTSAAA